MSAVRRPPSRPPWRVVRLLLLAWAIGGAVIVVVLARTPVAAPAGPATGSPAAGAAVQAEGRRLFGATCASCHGTTGGGVPGRGPTLRGVGAAAVDFYLSTGRMPLERPDVQPRRSTPAFAPEQIHALVAYVAGLPAPGRAAGPAIPVVRPDRGDLARGRSLFAENCSGCHQIMGRGGAAPGFVAPELTQATPRQIGEAMRVGPYLMPPFSVGQLDDHDVDSIARFVTEVVDQAPDRGGWGIGNVGPVPEGLVAILLGGGVVLLITRLIGERNR